MSTIATYAIDAAWKRADAERAFWEQHQDEYLARHPDQFVAVVDGSVVATGKCLDELLVALEAKGLEPTQTWVRYFNSHPSSSFF